MTTLYEQIGQITLEAIVRDFYDKAFDDVMIGYFFAGKDKEKLIRHQVQFTSQLLGESSIKYEGESLPQAHKKLAGLRKPHFNRRHILLKEAIERHGLPEDIKEEWLALERRLLPLILGRSATSKK